MPERCTCGAQLFPESRFCHKCGKPTFDEPEMEPEIVAPAEPAPVPVELPVKIAAEINFHNPLAVRIGLFLAVLTFLVSVLLGPLIVLWMLIAGVAAAWLYARRTGEQLTTLGGARLGWITGLFTFVILMVLITVMAFALSDKAFVDSFLAQMKQRGAEETARQLVEALQSPEKIAIVLVEIFLFCGLLPVLGGMLGAKLFRRSGTA